MAIAFFDGFESYGANGSSGTGLETNLGTIYDHTEHVFDGSNNCVISTGRLGGLCLKIQRSSYPLALARTFSGITNTVVFGMAIMFDLTEYHYMQQATFLQLLNGPIGDSGYGNLSLSMHLGGGPIIIRSGIQTAAMGYTDIALKEKVWYYLEGKVYSHASSGTVELKINGVTVATLASKNTAPAGVGFTGVSFPFCNAVYIDDFYFVTDQGGAPSFLGPITIEDLRPTGDDSVQWTPSAGNNYECVNDASLDSSDYVSSGTLNQKDLYTYSNLAVIDGTIQGVQLNTPVRITAAGSRILQSVCSSNGDEATLNIGIGDTVTKVYKPHLILTDPDTGSAWLTSAINAAKFGIKVAN